MPRKRRIIDEWERDWSLQWGSGLPHAMRGRPATGTGRANPAAIQTQEQPPDDGWRDWGL